MLKVILPPPIYHFLSEMRIKQWTKNLFVYAAILFHGEFFNVEALSITTLAFLSFSFTASGIYFFNDIIDIERDKLNPKKCTRPIAAGKISKSSGYFCAALLMIVGLTIAYGINFSCFMILLSYVILNLLYSIRLKHVIIIDVLIISYGFVSRTVIGALVTQIHMTIWFILCVMFLSLLLALGKRRYDNSISTNPQKVLHVEFFDQLITIVAAGVVMCYSLFTLDTNTTEMIFTLPLVLYGTFYYLYIVRVKQNSGAPDEVLYKETPILITVILYVASVIFIRNV